MNIRNYLTMYATQNARSLYLAALVLLAYGFGLIDTENAIYGIVLSQFGYMNILAWSKAIGTLFNGYTTAKTVINATDLVSLPANSITLGKTYHFEIDMALSNIVTTPGTVTFQIMLGNIVVWTSGAIQLNATAHTLLPARLVVDLRCSAVGAGTSAKFIGQGWLNGIHFTLTAAQVDAVNTPGMFPVPATAPADGTGFDSTIANILDFWVGFSINNAGNGVQVTTYRASELANY